MSFFKRRKYIAIEGGEKMAEALIIDSRLRLVFETGYNDKGEPIYKTKTYSNINKAATAAQLKDAAEALGSLCMHPLVTIERNDNYEIVE